MAELTATYILARMLWEFDMEIEPRSINWIQQKGCWALKKGSLYVKINDKSSSQGGKPVKWRGNEQQYARYRGEVQPH